MRAARVAALAQRGRERESVGIGPVEHEPHARARDDCEGGRVAVQVQTCGEAWTDIAPGKHYYGSSAWINGIDIQYLPAVPARRVIEGRVIVRCAGARSCQRVPVKDAVVTAKGKGGTFRALTDEQGRYEMSVKATTYERSPAGSVTRIRP